MDFESFTLFVENDILTAAFDFAYCTNRIVVIVLVKNFVNAFKNASQCCCLKTESCTKSTAKILRYRLFKGTVSQDQGILF